MKCDGRMSDVAGNVSQARGAGPNQTSERKPATTRCLRRRFYKVCVCRLVVDFHLIRTKQHNLCVFFLFFFLVFSMSILVIILLLTKSLQSTLLSIHRAMELLVKQLQYIVHQLNRIPKCSRLVASIEARYAAELLNADPDAVVQLKEIEDTERILNAIGDLNWPADKRIAGGIDTLGLWVDTTPSTRLPLPIISDRAIATPKKGTSIYTQIHPEVAKRSTRLVNASIPYLYSNLKATGMVPGLSMDTFAQTTTNYKFTVDRRAQQIELTLPDALEARLLRYKRHAFSRKDDNNIDEHSRSKYSAVFNIMSTCNLNEETVCFVIDLLVVFYKKDFIYGLHFVYSAEDKYNSPHHMSEVAEAQSIMYPV